MGVRAIPLPEGEVESASADRVRDYGLPGEGVTPHPLAFGESASPTQVGPARLAYSGERISGTPEIRGRGGERA
jgi:hypothetical protein